MIDKGELTQMLIESLENMTPEDWESITHNKFYTRWITRIHEMPRDLRVKAIGNLKRKYESDSYKDSEYSKGYEPRMPLYDILYGYSEKYAQRMVVPEDLDFCDGLYLIDDTYIIELLVGQGSVIHVFTREEWKDYLGRVTKL